VPSSLKTNKQQANKHWLTHSKINTIHQHELGRDLAANAVKPNLGRGGGMAKMQRLSRRPGAHAKSLRAL
jgi:hypothetical protein